MKNLAKQILQKILGYHNYLFIFSLYIIHTLKFQKKERDFLYFLKILPKNKSVLDIGANIGVMTYYLSKHLSAPKVFAFEPQPDNLKILKKVVDRYKLSNVEIHDSALGDTNGKIKMVLPMQGKTKLHGLSHVCHESISEFNSGLHYEVNIKKIDDMETVNNQQIGGIKLDVENFEYYVLKGSEELLKRDKPIIYTELWDNKNRVLCIDFLSNLGYQCKQYSNGKLIDFDAKTSKSQNFFFINLD
jgi:FkbM family methyltransferase